jgi:putative DNA primase/helicase
VNVPAGLRERSAWVLWRSEERDGKATKVPYRADGRGRASTTDPQTWGTFEQVAGASPLEAEGIGLVLDEISGIDLDDCFDPESRELEGTAGVIVGALDSYTEISPSGRGVHVFFKGRRPGERRRRGNVEWSIFGSEEPPRATQLSPVIELDDRELIERAFHSKSGAAFGALWKGETNGYPSQSEADLALCGALAFWTGPDPARIDGLFRRSGLMREKWDTRRGDSTYGAQTISRALEGRTEFYSGNDAATALPKVARDDEPEGDDFPEEEPFALELGEFIAAKSETPPALVGDESENLLPTFGLLILFAKGGKGKTTMIVDAALHFASGIAWLGFKLERPLRVLFIENEGPREPFRAKLALKRKLWQHEIGGAVFVQTFDWGAFTLADEKYAERLCSFVREHEIDLVIGDPLDSLGIDGVGSPEDTRKFMELMSGAGLFREVAFLLLHHPRKETTPDELDEVSGAWGGKPDTMLRLEKLDGNRGRLSFPKIRWSRLGTRKALILGFDPETESFSVVAEEEDEERDYAAEIEELLADGTWRITKEIAAPKKDGGIGANVDTIKRELEASPDRFHSCTGEEAKRLGRDPKATLWQCRTRPSESDESERVF